MGRDSEKGKYESPEGSYTWEYLSTFCCTISMFCIGNVLGWNSPVLGKLMASDSPIALTASDVSTMAAMVSVGHMMGPPLTMLLVDRFGRKKSLLIAGAPLIISWGLILVAKHAVILFAARFIAGVAVGLTYCAGPMYLGEIASPKFRGGNGMLITVMFNSGVLLMMVIVPYVSVKMSACICTAIATSFVVGMSFMPESPYFLAMIERHEEAEVALAKLRGKTDVSEEMELIKMTLLQRGVPLGEVKEGTKEPVEEKKFGALKQLCTVSGNRKAMGIMIIFTFSHHFGGFNTIMTYGQIIFEAMGIAIEAHICTIIVAILQFISTLTATCLIDRLGRKPLICVSGIVSGICLVIMGGYFYFKEYTEVDVTPYEMIAFVTTFGLVVAANIGLMPIQNVVLSEIFSTDIKALASCTFGVLSGLISSCTLKSYLLIATTWGYGQSVPFLAFAVITWACTAALMRMLPETKGKTFLEIQRDLNA